MNTLEKDFEVFKKRISNADNLWQKIDEKTKTDFDCQTLQGDVPKFLTDILRLTLLGEELRRTTSTLSSLKSLLDMTDDALRHSHKIPATSVEGKKNRLKEQVANFYTDSLLDRTYLLYKNKSALAPEANVLRRLYIYFMVVMGESLDTADESQLESYFHLQSIIEYCSRKFKTEQVFDVKVEFPVLKSKVDKTNYKKIARLIDLYLEIWILGQEIVGSEPKQSLMKMQVDGWLDKITIWLGEWNPGEAFDKRFEFRMQIVKAITKLMILMNVASVEMSKDNYEEFAKTFMHTTGVHDIFPKRKNKDIDEVLSMLPLSTSLFDLKELNQATDTLISEEMSKVYWKGYFPYKKDQINKTKEKLDHLNPGVEADKRQLSALKKMMPFLSERLDSLEKCTARSDCEYAVRSEFYDLVVAYDFLKDSTCLNDGVMTLCPSIAILIQRASSLVFQDFYDKRKSVLSTPIITPNPPIKQDSPKTNSSSNYGSSGSSSSSSSSSSSNSGGSSSSSSNSGGSRSSSSKSYSTKSSNDDSKVMDRSDAKNVTSTSIKDLDLKQVAENGLLSEIPKEAFSGAKAKQVSQVIDKLEPEAFAEIKPEIINQIQDNLSKLDTKVIEKMRPEQFERLTQGLKDLNDKQVKSLTTDVISKAKQEQVSFLPVASLTLQQAKVIPMDSWKGLSSEQAASLCEQNKTLARYLLNLPKDKISRDARKELEKADESSNLILYSLIGAGVVGLSLGGLALYWFTK